MKYSIMKYPTLHADHKSFLGFEHDSFGLKTFRLPLSNYDISVVFAWF